MTDKVQKNKIADILLDFYDEYHSNEINRPMIPSIYADKILNCLQEDSISEDQARRSAKIAREEIYNWLANHYRDYMHNPTGKKLEAFFGMDMITDLKQAMKETKD